MDAKQSQRYSLTSDSTESGEYKYVLSFEQEISFDIPFSIYEVLIY